MAAELKRASSVKITFLVDNTIEWFTKLPQGFTSELVNHIKEKHMPVDELTGVPVLDFDRFCCGAHGFAVLIETKIDGEEPHTILFDTGPDSLSLIRNIQAMKTDVSAVERIVLSHWHADHSGGMLSFLRHRLSSGSSSSIEKEIVADLHPSRPIARGIAPPPGDKVIARLMDDPKFEEIEELGAKVEKHDEPHVVAGGAVYVSGEIPRVTSFEQGLIGGMRWAEKKGWYAEPHIMDERYAAIDVLGKGLVIFSSCSHAGIINVVDDTVKTFNRPVHMVIGGLHLGGPELASRIQPTVEYLAKRMRPSPTYILPMHCTGFNAKIALEAALGEGCVPTGVGNVVKIDGDAEADKALFAPVIA